MASTTGPAGSPGLEPAQAKTAAPRAAAVLARDLWFGFPGREPTLRGLDFEAHAGEVTVVLGSSGGGKTTLLRLIRGILTPSRGELSVFGVPPTRGRRLDPAIAYIPQQLGLVRASTALQNALTGAATRIGLWRTLLGQPPAAEAERAIEVLTTLGIGDKADAPVHTLSGGERQRVAIARSLMQHPRLILADEVVSQLDVLTSMEIMDQLRVIARGGVAVIITTHEVELALRAADRLVVLRDGVRILDTSPTQATAELIASVLR